VEDDFNRFLPIDRRGKMQTRMRTGTTLIVLLVSLISVSWATKADERADLLKVREAVWRTWFAGDTKALKQLVPPDTIVISSGEEKWKNQADVLSSSAEFHAQGGKLVRLEFPRTEIQLFGDVAIVWSKYLVETETNGKRETSSGRVTEIFVKRHGQWLNAGWHTDTEK
jgi:ketosteroid isomerase-like protein